MDDEKTLQIPLPEGTRPDQENIITQEIPEVAQTVAMPEITETIVIETLPTRLLGDPILTMDEPKPPTASSVFEMIQEQTEDMVPPVPKPQERPRRKIQTSDKVLAGMGVMAVIGTTFVYGMVAYGWGRSVPKEATPKPSHTATVSVSPEPTEAPTPRPAAPPQRKKVLVIVAPRTSAPVPTHRTVITPSPSPTYIRHSEAPSAPQTDPVSPRPTETTPSPSQTPSGTPTPSPSTTHPTPPPIILEPR